MYAVSKTIIFAWCVGAKNLMSEGIACNCDTSKCFSDTV